MRITPNELSALVRPVITAACRFVNRRSMTSELKSLFMYISFVSASFTPRIFVQVASQVSSISPFYMLGLARLRECSSHRKSAHNLGSTLHAR